MVLLYCVFAFFALFFKPPRSAGMAAGEDPYGGPQNVEHSTQNLDVKRAQLQAAAYAAESEALDNERLQSHKEENLSAHAATVHKADVARSDTEQAYQTWQDRIESEALR